MLSFEQSWSELERTGELGGSKRVDERSAHDFYAAIDVDGKLGLQLVSNSEPPTIPEFDALEVRAAKRPDQRWLMSMWLKERSLTTVFAQLCDSIVETSKDVNPALLAAFVISRLLNWRRLLEAGGLETLGTNALRGLIGELIILQYCLKLWEAAQVIDGWIGPFHAPQDFALPGMLIETKAIMRSASTVRISSLEQLDGPPGVALRLAVVTLSPVVQGTGTGFSPSSLVAEIQQALGSEPQVLAEFENRLRAIGYADHKNYQEIMFRCDTVRFYVVDEKFPRVIRSQLSIGITKASYDISLSSFDQYEVPLEK